MWLRSASHQPDTRAALAYLPILLQVLLSLHHRIRALELLDRFLSLGPWAVKMAVSVNIVQYAYKLLGSPVHVRCIILFLFIALHELDSCFI